ncbi:MAG: InlB B-repeat-containing protein, partial [Treponema sp.]|nr:InlB B-repeat-containing protein [Treponema sp.]
MKKGLVVLLAALSVLALMGGCESSTTDDEAVGYTVTFNANGGTGTAPAAQTAAAGASMTLPGGSGLSKEGFVFGGWNTKADGTGINYAAGESYTPVSSVILYAKWISQSETLTVSFNTNGGTGTKPNDMTIISGDSITLPSGEGLSKEGFLFGGWNTNDDGTGTNYAAGASYTPASGITLYARWIDEADALTVTFNANGGTGTKPNDMTVIPGDSITLPGGEGLLKDGCLFGGWNTKEDGTGDDYAAGAPFTPEDDADFYAKWIDAASALTVTFNANGGTGTKPDISVTSGDSITLPGGDGLSKEGYLFDGWNTKEDGTGDDYAEGASFTPQADTTLYAKWTQAAAVFTVTFNANGGTGTKPNDMTVTSGDSITLPGGDEFSKEGFLFDGWNTKADGTGDDYAVGASFTPQADITLYAKWTQAAAVFTVTFNANGGAGTKPNDITAAADEEITLPGKGGLSKTGFLFGGWNTANDGSGINFNEGDAYTITGAATFYAVWIDENFAIIITFNANGGAGNIPIRYAGMDEVIILPTGDGFLRDGYVFGRWNTAANGSGVNYNAGAEYLVANSITFYAVWIPLYTVSFNANNGTGTVPESQTVKSGEYITLPGGEGLSRNNHIFTGWNANADGTGTTYNAGAQYHVTNNATLYVVWKQAYTVIFDANGGTGTVANQMGEMGKSITLSNGDGFSRDGYVFGSWNTLADGTGTNYNAGAAYSSTSFSNTLYAMWIPLYAVSFNANGGTGTIPDSQMVIAGDSITLPNGDGFSRDGYGFGNWNTAANGLGTDYAEGAAYTVPSGGSTLYAKWIPLYTVSFDINEGTGTAPTSHTIKAGDSITLPDGNNFSRPAFEFVGWNTAADGTGNDYAVGAAYTVTTAATLYAKWIPLYTVSFNINGGTGTVPASQTVKDGSSITLPGGDGLSKEWYLFNNWNTSADGTGTAYAAGASYTVTADIVLYTMWGTVPGANLSAKFTWLDDNAKSDTKYLVEVNANDNLVRRSLSYSGKSNITIKLEGIEGEKTISLYSILGSLFTIESVVTLILDNNIILKGLNNNNASLVKINSGGTLEMNEGAKITGNTNTSSEIYVYGGGVYVNGGTFIMSGGEISGNTVKTTNSFTGSSICGGGVYVNSGAFTMRGGKISDNTINAINQYQSVCGGGVYVNSGTFIMEGGEISGNYANETQFRGGGVYVNGGAFIMEGGEIFENKGSGEVFVNSGTFTMEGGEIFDNTAETDFGDGV